MPKSRTKAQTQARASNTTTTTTNKPPAPNWPPLRPLLPAADLHLTPLVQDQIYLIRNFLPSSLCKNYAAFLSTLPLTTTPGRPKKDEAVRVNDRFQVEDQRFAETLWNGTALRDLVTERFGEEDGVEGGEEHGDGHGEERVVGEGKEQRLRETWGGVPLGLNPNIRIYRYSKGQFFAQHYDESNTLTFLPASTTKPLPARTTWTLLIYLTSCAGGETVFYPDPSRAHPRPSPIEVAPQAGMALLHRHGDRCMLHEGREVTGGEKWVIRSDLVVEG
ncbi:Uncharacterized protein PECH_003782 [Penicillium ucsense]|uniref:Fe2OG dioxygenase domain-containing protein n=1 Tax=Penicillium ucsense TaxID=2839758 RepID=A0A8J8WIH1_9EURO|nr:Uncharacterized protein PECM_008741 [Penicillium ucsense]KAF7729099.1 Uncharacterized protein PECH_003782 [Penicillium ucsense]